MPELTVTAVPAFADNYIWLITTGGAQCAVVDPGEAAPVLAALSKHGLQLNAVLITHHHADHIGGVSQLVGQTGAAVGVGLWCAIVVGTADNLLRPLLIGKDTEMPDLLVMVTTLGGLALFGAAGMLIGPIVGAPFTSVWGLWGVAVEEAERPDHETGSGG